MDKDAIQKLCPRAENINILGDGTIGMKVGEFAQAINIGLTKGHPEEARAIRDLYNQLLSMNREQDRQIEMARANAIRK